MDQKGGVVEEKESCTKKFTVFDALNKTGQETVVNQLGYIPQPDPEPNNNNYNDHDPKGDQEVKEIIQTERSIICKSIRKHGHNGSIVQNVSKSVRKTNETKYSKEDLVAINDSDKQSLTDKIKDIQLNNDMIIDDLSNKHLVVETMVNWKDIVPLIKQIGIIKDGQTEKFNINYASRYLCIRYPHIQTNTNSIASAYSSMKQKLIDENLIQPVNNESDNDRWKKSFIEFTPKFESKKVKDIVTIVTPNITWIENDIGISNMSDHDIIHAKENLKMGEILFENINQSIDYDHKVVDAISYIQWVLEGLVHWKQIKLICKRHGIIKENWNGSFSITYLYKYLTHRYPSVLFIKSSLSSTFSGTIKPILMKKGIIEDMIIFKNDKGPPDGKSQYAKLSKDIIKFGAKDLYLIISPKGKVWNDTDLKIGFMSEKQFKINEQISIIQRDSRKKKKIKSKDDNNTQTQSPDDTQVSKDHSDNSKDGTQSNEIKNSPDIVTTLELMKEVIDSMYSILTTLEIKEKTMVKRFNSNMNISMKSKDDINNSIDPTSSATYKATQQLKELQYEFLKSSIKGTFSAEISITGSISYKIQT